MDISLNGIKIVNCGKARFDLRPEAKKSMKSGNIRITVDLKAGKASATAWTCDFTEGYIKINARYN
jgi:glutamate N-acetyltransferase/amino-acid N-acetyltransferase